MYAQKSILLKRMFIDYGNLRYAVRCFMMNCFMVGRAGFEPATN